MKKRLIDKTDVILQYGNKNVAYGELMRCMEDVWTRDLGKKLDEIERLHLYVKPEEGMVYYVVNATMTGSFEL